MENVIKVISGIKGMCDKAKESGFPEADFLSILCATVCGRALEEMEELSKGNAPTASIGAFYEAISASCDNDVKALYIRQAEAFIREGIPFQPAISLTMAKVTVERLLAEAA
jgi:hypothetical protein